MMYTGRRITAIMIAVSIGLHAAAIAWVSVKEPAAHESEELGILVSMAPPAEPEPSEPEPEPQPSEPEPAVVQEAITPIATQPVVAPAVEAPADAIPLQDYVEPRIVPQPVEDTTLSSETMSSPVTDLAVAVTYEERLIAWLARQKRYPKLAMRRGVEGECIVRVLIDRAGQVQASVLESSSKSSLLDREAMAMVDRANPFPVPPEEVPGGTLEYLFPVRFDLQ